jgi:NADH/F420H2 dehydrogenase subunit C
MQHFNFYIKYFEKILPKYCNYIIKKKIKPRELLILSTKKYIYYFLLFMKNNSFFQTKILADICCIDYPNRSKRFEIIYNLLSVRYNFRFLVKTYLSVNSYLYSIAPLFNSANWLERENWDLFGIFFFNHPDLRRILTDYGFEGYPLRKDFPLTGYIELRYDDENSNIVYESVELAQEYRLFNFTSPWEELK